MSYISVKAEHTHFFLSDISTTKTKNQFLRARLTIRKLFHLTLRLTRPRKVKFINKSTSNCLINTTYNIRILITYFMILRTGLFLYPLKSLVNLGFLMFSRGIQKTTGMKWVTVIEA